ncbi:hypothetical protein RDI58_003325 [Solanum bulbocastanum]|uniref:Uncharacterized protein n=1 Tax=Solanum bulbocastanum TaxID=147425 RepID=A0AAN8UG45_SOLBU
MAESFHPPQLNNSSFSTKLLSSPKKLEIEALVHPLETQLGFYLESLLLGIMLPKYTMPWDSCLFQYSLGTDLTYLMDRELVLHFPGDAILSLQIAKSAVYHDAEIYLLDDTLSAVDAHVGRSILHNAILGPRMNQQMCILSTHYIQEHFEVYILLFERNFYQALREVNTDRSYRTIVVKYALRKLRWFELEGYTVDTMAFICRGTKPFTFKNMTKMASTSSTIIATLTLEMRLMEHSISNKETGSSSHRKSCEWSATTSTEVGANTKKLVILPTPLIPVKTGRPLT